MSVGNITFSGAWGFGKMKHTKASCIWFGDMDNKLDLLGCSRGCPRGFLGKGLGFPTTVQALNLGNTHRQ